MSGTYRAPGHPCDEDCLRAKGDATTCICSCGGKNHGVEPMLTGEQYESFMEFLRVQAIHRLHNPFARIPPVDDDAW